MKQAETITPQHLELLQSLSMLKSETQLAEVRALIAAYLEGKIDDEIKQVEAERGYTQSTYDGWLNEQQSCV